jgi:hypothetical protein
MKSNPQLTADQASEQTRPREQHEIEPAVKKTFVEPTVSSPADVLEATAFFQAPTIESSTT